MGRRIHSLWRPDEGRSWALAEAARACARENKHHFPDPPERQETHAYADVDGVRQAVAASREIVRCRDCRRFLFITGHGRPWGPAVREMCRPQARQLTLGLTAATGERSRPS